MLTFMAAVILAATSAGRAEPAQDQTRPAWLRQPQFRNLVADANASSLRDRDITIRCQAVIDGTLEACDITDDSGATISRPLKQSIQEGLRAARIRPATENGQPVARQIAFTFSLRINTAVEMQARRIVDPLWLEAPTAGEIEAVRPSGAAVFGMASLDCGLDGDGRPADCRVRVDRPLGRGFGNAALPLAKQFRTGMRLPEGVDRDDVRVDISIVFPGPETPEDASFLFRPTWLAAPTTQDLADLFPAMAREQGIREGRATAICVVQADGHLGGCEVSDAAPGDVGFEAAVRDIAPRFAVSPWVSNGRPTYGRQVRLPFVFVDPAQAVP